MRLFTIILLIFLSACAGSSSSSSAGDSSSSGGAAGFAPIPEDINELPNSLPDSWSLVACADISASGYEDIYDLHIVVNGQNLESVDYDGRVLNLDPYHTHEAVLIPQVASNNAVDLEVHSMVLNSNGTLFLPPSVPGATILWGQVNTTDISVNFNMGFEADGNNVYQSPTPGISQALNFDITQESWISPFNSPMVRIPTHASDWQGILTTPGVYIISAQIPTYIVNGQSGLLEHHCTHRSAAGFARLIICPVTGVCDAAGHSLLP